jgi:hypothetical protein
MVVVVVLVLVVVVVGVGMVAGGLVLAGVVVRSRLGRLLGDRPDGGGEIGASEGDGARTEGDVVGGGVVFGTGRPSGGG